MKDLKKLMGFFFIGKSEIPLLSVPGCEVYVKNDAIGKYPPDTEIDGLPIEIMDEKKERLMIYPIKIRERTIALLFDTCF